MSMIICIKLSLLFYRYTKLTCVQIEKYRANTIKRSLYEIFSNYFKLLRFHRFLF